MGDLKAVSGDHGEKDGVAAGNENPLDESIIERVTILEMRQSAASAAFSVALGRIAADALASSGR